MFLDMAGLTDRGDVRRRNTDQFLIAELNKSIVIRRSTLPVDHQRKLATTTVGYLMLVADGWRQGSTADRAADLAIVTSVEFTLALLPWFFDAVKGAGDVTEKLEGVLETISTSLSAPGDGSQVPDRCETAMTMAFLIWPTLFAVHHGRSCLYLLRGNELHHLTADGAISGPSPPTKTLATHGHRAEPFQSMLRVSTGRQIHVHQATIGTGDTILLCTDGLVADLGDQDVALILREDLPADSTCLRLIHAAKQAGGSDNTTVIVARAMDDEHNH